MSNIPPTLPFRIQAAYGVQPSAKTQPVSASKTANKLVAAQVQGKVAFSDSVELTGRPSQKSAAPRDVLTIYRNPAERNSAATGVLLGRSLDAKA